jgi:hypothetical protein
MKSYSQQKTCLFQIADFLDAHQAIIPIQHRDAGSPAHAILSAKIKRSGDVRLVLAYSEQVAKNSNC